jgi:VWFA-related protein
MMNLGKSNAFAVIFANWHVRSAPLALSVLTSVLSCSAAANDANGSSCLPTYRSAVSEVRVTFFATDQNHDPLETLTDSDFAVVDNERVVRNFRSFTHSDETLLDVVVAVDASESVVPRSQVAVSAVRQLVEWAQSIPDNKISVLSFGGTSGGMVGGTSVGLPSVVCSKSCHAPDSVNKLHAAKGGGTTPLFDALILAADFISQNRRADSRSNVRTILILFSDGNDNFSLHTAQEALEAVRTAGALVYSVDLGTSRNQWSNRDTSSAFLQQVSHATGGRYFSSSPFSRPDSTAAVLKAVLDDLRASYVVTYDLPSHQAGFHSLQLLPTRNLNLTFHSRNGYNYEPGGN